MSSSPGLRAASAEPIAAAAAGVVAFGAAGALLAVSDSAPYAVLVGALCAAVVVALAREWGVAYAAPVAISCLVAFDWYVLPPTRPFGVPRSSDSVTLAAYVAVGVLIGQLAARARHRAAASEEGRSELAGEQAALRRLATRVARGEPAEALFSAVAREVGELFDMDGARVVRYVGEDEVYEHTGWCGPGQPQPPTGLTALEPFSLAAAVRRSGAAVRVDDYASTIPVPAAVGLKMGIRVGIAAPIVVDGALWGTVSGWWRGAVSPPAGVEDRLAGFTELVATAISNAESHEEQLRLAQEQAALRRVATLVASEPAPGRVFAAVAEELGRLLTIDNTVVYRFEPDETGTVVAVWGPFGASLPVGLNLSLDGEHVLGRVSRTGRSARIDDFSSVSGELGGIVRRLGTRSAVGAPITVEGRLWGAVIASTTRPEPLPAVAEMRVAEFTQLVATAIANIDARAEVAESRARLMAAADAERRRVVRDLHDGAQQRLVHTVITLKLAREALGDAAPDPAATLLDEALENARRATGELRELAHGILPAVLTDGGLPAAVEALAARMPLPVDAAVDVGRLPAPVEATAYFVLAEALTNVAKHAQAARVAVGGSVAGGALRLTVCDDGVGGAQAAGSGLLGIADRVAVFDGGLELDSPAGGGTTLAVTIPLEPDGRAID